jgi:hypothetical protein
MLLIIPPKLENALFWFGEVLVDFLFILHFYSAIYLLGMSVLLDYYKVADGGLLIFAYYFHE